MLIREENILSPGRDRRGSVVVEFGLVAPLFVAMVIFLLVLGLWLYNSSVAAQAARLAAHHLAVTGDARESRDQALRHLRTVSIATEGMDVAVWRDGDTARAQANLSMKNFYPGLPKLLGGGGWNGPIKIQRKVGCVIEYRFRNPSEFN
ncbi:pilus assembly protein [Desulfofundulus sp. TPOSR]|uniref:TadE/TadG family type IV pilus assembly protein n=1 Tax=Desulfofundulus sp. TPOSR TaxID=2714340 RepID=UPI00140746C8|nr:TadE family protein [Desulfofundulus sp. TPOSR]NHM26969.1 pilus assembly protein [Desulfofundulus sp. TPOSR]